MECQPPKCDLSVASEVNGAGYFMFSFSNFSLVDAYFRRFVVLRCEGLFSTMEQWPFAEFSLVCVSRAYQKRRLSSFFGGFSRF